MKTKSRYKQSRRALIFWCLFIGTGAVAGSVGMLVKPDGSALGMQELLAYFQTLPFSDRLFQNFLFPGIALLVVNGLTNLLAAAVLLAGKKAGLTLGSLFGFTLMLWICIQFVIFPANFMSTIYFIFGFLQLVTGIAASVFYKQEQFTFDPGEYTNIASERSTIVVFFSRMGYVKKLAYERADELGADVYEVISKERTDGTAGFWWCGRFAMHKWPMPIEDVDVDLSAYERVVICTPIWVFGIAAPIRSFCEKAKGRIKSVDYILVHNRKSEYLSAAEEMDDILGTSHGSVTSVCCKQGELRSADYGTRARKSSKV